MKMYLPSHNTWLTSTAVTAAAAIVFSTGAIAQTSTIESAEQMIEAAAGSDSSERLELASRLRTLSQQVAASSCTLGSGIATEESRNVLARASMDFSRYLNALRNGDEDLGILAAEANRKILHDLTEIEAEWTLLETAVADVLDDPNNIQAIHLIDGHNLILLELTNTLAADIKGRYSNPFMVSQRDSMMIELAGRQLMLTQKMAKDACEIWSGYNVDTAAADLAQTMEIFENSLRALRNGLPAAGIPEAPTEEIAAKLDQLLARWEEIVPPQQALLNGEEISDEDKALIFHDYQLELVDLRKLLGHYRDFAQRNI